MSKDSKIEWTDDTHQFVSGCDDASPGCAHCYAKRQAHRMASNPNAKVQARYRGLTVVRGNGPQWTGEVRPLPDQLAVFLRQRAPRTIFVNSLSDTFHADIPDEYIAAMFGVMAFSPQHTCQVLTKRAERMRQWFEWIERVAPHGTDVAYCAEAAHEAMTEASDDGTTPVDGKFIVHAQWPLPNVYLGVSVENKKHGVPRIALLRATPAKKRFLSVEPLLEDLGTLDLTGIHQVIVGSESGPKARPMEEDWVRSIRDQCVAANVPFFYKQRLDAKRRKVSLPMLDGRQWAEMPASLPVVGGSQ